MARMTVASGSRAASRDALGCVFQHNTHPVIITNYVQKRCEILEKRPGSAPTPALKASLQST